MNNRTDQADQAHRSDMHREGESSWRVSQVADPAVSKRMVAVVEAQNTCSQSQLA
jgi:hypothetical protein